MQSLDEYQIGWHHTHKVTSSSLLGLHFDHYMAGVEAVLMEKINRLMATIPLLTGISPAQWCDALNIMLKKVTGNCAVKKLCIIMLFKADFNNNNKWISQAVMQNVEQWKEIAPEQYGSCNNKAAGTQCLNKRLFYDYIQAMHIPVAPCLNDAKSCYDQIILFIMALCLCCLGALVPATNSMIATLAQLRHHV